MNTRSVLVVGGGIAGVSAAYWLSELDSTLDVTLLEAESHLAYHATGRSAALFILNYGTAANRALARAGHGFLESPPTDLIDGSLLTDREHLMVGRPADSELIDDALAGGSDAGLETREIEFSHAANMFPPVNSKLFNRAMVEPGSSDIDVAALHQGFLRGYRTNGGEVVTGQRVTSIDRDGSSWLVATGDKSFEADVLVNAAGAWGDQLAELAGLSPVGLSAFRRTVFMVASPSPDSGKWPRTGEIDHSWYVKPDGSQLLCSPADEVPSEPCDAKPEEIDVAMAIDRINAATDIGIRSVASSWAGLRTFAPDRTIVIGPDPMEAAFFWCVGQGGSGIQSSPGAGRLLADLVLDGEPSDYFDGSGLRLSEVLPDRLF